ncbi:hypothetical protein BBP40_006280 [Aspergillus hancockii]|nr:hypothetical protein BBP40_006280 [Aspergillus hancockii]
MRSEAETVTSGGGEDSDSKESRSKDDMTGLPRFPNPNRSQEPLSTSIKRELRLQLPRLQTNNADSVGQSKQEVEADMKTKSEEYARCTEDIKNFSPKNELDSYVFKEKFFVSTTKITCSVSGDAPERIDMAQAPEMIYELEGGIPTCQSEYTSSDHLPILHMPINLPDEVVLSLLHQVCSLDDLFRLALISKQFYRVFKEHELGLIKSAVFTMSPPAWELREMSPPWNTEWQVLVDPDTPVPEYTPALYLQRYAQDIYTLAQLKSLILMRCETFLRPETIRGLAGKDDTRAAEIDDAFWRIWTFCRIFGCGKSREGDVIGQVDWLDGGSMAVGNHKSGAAASVTEPFAEDDTTRAEAVLEEWTYYVITLGPSAVLNLASIGPGGCAATFRRAQSIGLTRWEFSESGASRSSFFKEAVSKAYKPQCDSPVPELSASSSQSSRSSSSRDAISPASKVPSKVKAQEDCHRRRQAVYAEQLRNQRRQSLFNPGFHSFEDERPISKYSLIMSRLDGLPYEHRPLPSPTMIASYGARCASPAAHYAPKPRPPLPMYHHPQVQDPVDQAIDLMVRELGFKEEDVKWALKITDSGEGINANAAVSLLLRERQKFERQNTVSTLPSYRSNSLLSSVIRSPESLNSVWRWA